MFMVMYIFFFFSSRRRHTRYWRDWSSDVCSSDLVIASFWRGGSVKAAAAISTLPPRQKDAMTALLHERLDNLILVVDSFKEFDMDIEAARWPAEEDEKRLRKASISAARRSVARSMNIDLKLYKEKGASFFHLK